MKVLVAGANGLVGSRLVKQLLAAGHQVVGLGRGPKRTQADFDYRSCDLTLRGEVLPMLSSAHPEVILNTASMTEVDACEKAPEVAFAANVTAAALLAEGAKGLGAHLVHISTDYVFDGERGDYSEADLPNPRGVYAVTKHMGEQAVRVFSPSAAIARTAVVYGWPQAARPNFGAWLYGALQKGEPVKLFEDQYVSPSLADSVAEQVAELGLRKLSGIWNTCGATVVNRVEFGRALCDVFGLDSKAIVPTRLLDLKLASPRPLKSGLSVKKAERELAAKPLPLADALRRFRQAVHPETGR